MKDDTDFLEGGIVMTMIYAGNDMLQKKMGFYKMVMALTCVSSVLLMFIGTPRLIEKLFRIFRKN